MNFGDRSAMSAVMAVVQAEFRLDDVRLGMLGSVFLWSYALGSPIAGWLGDRWSRTQLVVGSLAVWSVVVALTALAAGYPMLLLLRFALGASECLFLPAAIALIAAHHPVETRARAMSLITVGANGGMIAGGSLAGSFADHVSWRAGIFVLGLAGVALALCARTALPKSVSAITDAPRQSAIAAVREVLGVPVYWLLLGEALLSGVGVWIFFTWLPLYFRESFGLSLGAAGFAGTSILQVSVVLGMFVGGWVSDLVAAKAPHRRLLLFSAGYLGAAPCLLLFLGRPSFTVVAVAVSAFSFLRGFAQSNERPTQCEVVDAAHRATGIGIMNAVATGAGGCGVLLAGMLKREIGLGGVFAGVSLCYVGAAVLLLFAFALRRRR
ncbi:MFS transporter [Oleiharenicola sp. Vm1]|uniref:MFS transporter n=1 Tax=Oleiharenicola sp. Vm1 TaxID=3398393 RepID=UPI0039F610DB